MAEHSPAEPPAPAQCNDHGYVTGETRREAGTGQKIPPLMVDQCKIQWENPPNCGLSCSPQGLDDVDCTRLKLGHTKHS
jgi:hypothetical protein